MATETERKRLRIGSRCVGDGEPVYVIAEIGINHDGSVAQAEKLVQVAKDCGADAVKFQVRTPEISTPAHMHQQPKDTPWGERMPYIEYRRRMELPESFFRNITGIDVIVSVWDTVAMLRMKGVRLAALKVASACCTDGALLDAYDATELPVIVSTGAVTGETVAKLATRYRDRGVMLQCTASYPSKPSEINLRCIPEWRRQYGILTGYSGHETGLQCSLAAVAMGACVVERHLTLDRSLRGSDHAASMEPDGFAKLVRDIRIFEQARGDGVKRVYESELKAMERLRRVPEVV